MKLKLEGRFASAALKAPSPKVILGLRPEDLTLANSDGATQIPAHIEAIETMGAETHLHTKTAAHSLIARLPGHNRYRLGDAVMLEPCLANLHLFDAQSESALTR